MSDHNGYVTVDEWTGVSEYVCPHCGASASFERQSVTVWDGDVPVGNAQVLSCSACGVLHEVLSAPTDP